MGEKVRVAFLGTRHPHMWHRVSLLQEMVDKADVIGFFDEDDVTTEKFAARTGFKPYESARLCSPKNPNLL